MTIGGGTYHFVYDDEDRLTSLTLPSGTIDSFTYNGLGLRTGKTDSTGSYAYVCDGTSPGSPVLTDGAAFYTPGLSEYRNGASRYYSNDLLGNLWTIDGSSKGQAYYQDTMGFGTTLGSSGSGSPFGYGGGNGCQTDADTGLILMGHRYYDTRIGRFISQDPAGSGDNWYAYAGNSPTNAIDPLGLFDSTGMDFHQIYNEASYEGGPGSEWTTTDAKGNVVYQLTVSTFNDLGMVGGTLMHIPNGEDIGRNIAAARQFMASKDSYSYQHINGNGVVYKHDPKKIADWLKKHVGDGAIWDYKGRGKRYDYSGHVDYAAVASECRISLFAIIVAQEDVHEENHPGTPLEPTDGEILGYQYDENLYHPGGAEFGVLDFWGQHK